MNESLKQKVHELIEKHETWVMDLRRDLHQNPELGNEEFKTTNRIVQELKGMGVSIERPLNTGVLGILKGEGAGGPLDAKGEDEIKVIALRADIDALPIQEQLRLPFSSVTDGIMHACGHDAHTAILLGTAKVLSELKDSFRGTVKFLFQPAEETIGGAQRMIDAGCLKEPDPDYVFGLHVMPELPAGVIGLNRDRVHASSDMFTIKVKGLKSHGAAPHCGVDAIVAASQIVTNIQAIISRTVNPLEAAVISIGSFHAGHAMNIVADEAALEGTIRTFQESVREHLRCKLRDTVELTAKASGAFAEIHFQKGYDALKNHKEGVYLAEKAIKEMIGDHNLHILQEPTMGVDDFSYFLQKYPGAFFFLGCGFPHRENPPIHTDWFQINEKCIPTGIAAETAIVLHHLTGE